MKKIKFKLKRFKLFLNKKKRELVKKIRNINKTKRFVVICTIIVMFFTVGVTFGRYAYLEIKDYYFASKNFYFNSDKLKENMARYQVDNWSGADDYPIIFNMNSYKNNNVYATSDIEYDIQYSCSTNVLCSITQTQGVITTEKHTDSFTVVITPNAVFKDGDTAWLEVSATSSSPYEKTLSGRFVIKIGKIGTSYEIVDKVGSPYFDLNITNTLDYYLVKEAFDSYEVNTRLDISTYLALTEANKEKCTSVGVNLSFDPNVVILDMTNEKYLKATDVRYQQLDGFQYVNGMSFKVDALSSSVVRFYKSDTTIDYTYPFVSNNPIVSVTFD